MPRNPKTGDLMTDSQLKELNRQRFMQGLQDGNLGNIGPITDEGGTSFSTDRWKSYFDENPDEAPSDWTGDSESYIAQVSESSSQEFVVDRNDIDIRDEQDLEPSYPSRGKDKSFLTVDQAKAELAKEVEDDMSMEADIEKDFEGDNEFDTTVEGWVSQFEALSDEDFDKAGLAIDQLPANAQEAYSKMAGVRDDIKFEDALAKGAKHQQDEIDAITSQATDISQAKDALNVKAEDARDRVNSQIDDALIELNYQQEIKDIDDFYDGTTEKKGMLTTNTQELGKGSGEAEADALLRDQAKDFEISDMGEKDREITTTIMKDTGLDMDQANALMGKLKGLCG